jgi:6-phosphogluconolactonase
LRHWRTSFLVAACLLAALPGRAVEYLVYAGTYTNRGGKGIYLYRFQTATGKLTPEGPVAETPNPTFLVENPNHKVIYAVNENTDQAPGTVSAFAINPKNGKLVLLNRASSRGSGPRHMAVDSTGKWLAVANGTGGSIAILPVEADGRVGEAVAYEKQPEKSLLTGVAFSPDNHYLLAADEGLDRILVYRFDAAKGALAANDPAFAEAKPESQPRHLAFHPAGKVLYVVNEKTSNVTVYHWDAARGALEDFQNVLTWPMGFNGTSAALELAVNPAGTVLYVSNRGLDGFAQFAIDPEKFTLTAMDYPPAMGHNPREFALDPSGRFLFVANQDSGNIAVFRVHPRTGQLQPTRAVGLHVPSLACVLFVPEK